MTEIFTEREVKQDVISKNYRIAMTKIQNDLTI